MRFLDFVTEKVAVGWCCCRRSGEVQCKEGKETMELAPNSRLYTGREGAAGATATRASSGVAALPSPLRFSSTKLSTRRVVSPGPSIVASLASTGPSVLRSERRDLALAAGAKVIPHPDKIAKGGEDAYFISDYNAGVLGVADGVSGWASENVDPAKFSKELMAHALAAVGSEEVRNDPRRLLAKAHSATCSIGAATAIVAILDKKGTLHVANLGDCGLRVVRKGKVVYATAPQQHYFDCPFQLSSEHAQTAGDAMVYELGVLEGDTIVMGSDGLFDNVYDHDIESTVKVLSGDTKNFATRIAMALASLAAGHAKDARYDSPYSREAVLQGHNIPWWRRVLVRQRIGGKLDDITVVVGHIVGTSKPLKSEALPVQHDTGDAPAIQQDKIKATPFAKDIEVSYQPSAEAAPVRNRLETPHSIPQGDAEALPPIEQAEVGASDIQQSNTETRLIPDEDNEGSVIPLHDDGGRLRLHDTAGLLIPKTDEKEPA